MATQPQQQSKTGVINTILLSLITPMVIGCFHFLWDMHTWMAETKIIDKSQQESIATLNTRVDNIVSYNERKSDEGQNLIGRVIRLEAILPSETKKRY